MQNRKYDNSGIAFQNDRKRPGKNDADFTGSITIDGKSYWLNIWKKTGPKGTFLTSSVRPKLPPSAMPDSRKYYNQVAPENDQRAPQRQQYNEQPKNQFNRGDMDDDIPF